MDSLANKNIERSVISTMLMSNVENMQLINDGLTEDCFTDSLCKTLYRGIIRSANDGLPYDDVILLTETIAKYQGKEVELADVLDIMNETDGRLSIGNYKATLIDLQLRRATLMELQKVMNKVTDITADFDETIAAGLENLKTSSTSQVAKDKTLDESIADVYKIMDDNMTRDVVRGVKTGFRRLDKFGGLHATNLVIIAADSSQGKTSFAGSIALNATKDGSRIAFYSMEMLSSQLTARLIAAESGVGSNTILYNRLDETRIKAIDKAVGRLEHYAGQIYFDERSTNSIDSILSSIRTLHARHHIHMAIIDYLQIISIQGKGESKEQAIASAARRLKNIAKELKIVVVVLSQLNRKKGDDGDPYPTVDRLRDSGQINEAADETLLIYRPERYGRNYSGDYTNVRTEGTAEIIVGKDRQGSIGGVGSFIVGFDAQTTKFYDLDSIPYKTGEEIKVNTEAKVEQQALPF